MREKYPEKGKIRQNMSEFLSEHEENDNKNLWVTL